MSDPAAERDAAAIWARATARRDGLPVRSVDETLPGVRRRLLLDDAALLVVRDEAAPVGFAVVAPRSSLSGGTVLEVFYLAVDPASWGHGVGGRLLDAVDDHARVSGLRTLELWVIADNDRAIAAYERAGWTRTGELQEKLGSRPELRLVRNV